MTHALTVGSLFSGIGGIELGLTRCGMELRWLCEIDPFCRVRISRHWPRVPNLGDVRAVGWACVEPVDLVAGGFPCQPVSLAGKRRGVDDERWLWPEFERCLRALRPRFALVENVPGLLVRGFGDVLGGLAALGYDAQWDCIPAAAVGAPHRRDRVFIVAYAPGQRPQGRRDGQPGQPSRSGGLLPTGPSQRAVADTSEQRRSEGRAKPKIQPGQSSLIRSSGEGLADTEERTERSGLRESGSRRQRRRRPGDGIGARVFDRAPERNGFWDDCDFVRGQDGALRPIKPGVRLLAHGIPRRVDKLRALGNAVVPQIAEHVGRCILRFAEDRA